MVKSRFSFSIMFCFILAGNISSQESVLSDKIYKPSIKTVLLHRQGWELTYPLMELNSEEHLKLSFDDLTSETKNYSYTLIHCNEVWAQDMLSPSEYMEGFTSYDITDYQYSFNTYMQYTHYEVTIPNENINPVISGNYIIKVYENHDEEKVVLTRRFSIVEPIVNIEGEIKRPALTVYRNNSQQVNFKVGLQGLTVDDPLSEIKVVVLQNNRWETAISGLKPVFMQNNLLDYTYQDKNIFPGLREFRYFDLKSLRYQSEYIQKISYEAPLFHVYLFPTKIMNPPKYFYNEDLNGKYYVEIQEEPNKTINADYVYVHFSILNEIPSVSGDYYVLGNLTNWNCLPENKLTYNFETKCYETTLLLKQGYYNYLFGFLPTGETVPDIAFVEGSHYETENDYLIYVYYRPLTGRYDRLVGIKLLNSLNQGAH